MVLLRGRYHQYSINEVTVDQPGTAILRQNNQQISMEQPSCLGQCCVAPLTLSSPTVHLPPIFTLPVCNTVRSFQLSGTSGKCK